MICVIAREQRDCGNLVRDQIATVTTLPRNDKRDSFMVFSQELNL